MKNTEFGFYNENTAKNAPYITVNGVTFYFSYSTCVGVQFSEGTIVHQNNWQTTTGKHLNWIDGGSYQTKKDRLNSDQFKKVLKRAMKEAKVKELPKVNI